MWGDQGFRIRGFVGLGILAVLLYLAIVVESLVPKGSLHGHLTFDELNKWIQETVLPSWGNLTRLLSVGQSVEGRPLYVLCLGESCHSSKSSPSKQSDSVGLLKPDSFEWKHTGQVLFTGLHHAREPLGMMAMVAFVDDLLNRLEEGDLTVRHLLKRRQIAFFFVVNPDGYIANEKGSGMRRKNFGKRNDKNCPIESRTGDFELGVDLNRNYDFCFHEDNVGASSNPCAIDYEGPHPFSEPETIAMKRFVEANNFKVAFNYHSFGKEVYIPYSCKPRGKTKDEDFFRTYASRLTKKNGYRYGQPWNEGLYSVNGDAADWMYATRGIFAVSPEVAPADPVKSEYAGFWIEDEQVPKLARETLDMNYIGTWTAGSFVEIAEERITMVDTARRIEFSLMNMGLIPTQGLTRAAMVSLYGTIIPLEITSDSASVLLLPKAQNSFKVTGTIPSSVNNATIIVFDDLDCIVYRVDDSSAVHLQYRIAPHDDPCRSISGKSASGSIPVDESSDNTDSDSRGEQPVPDPTDLDSLDLPPLLVTTFFVVLGALIVILALAAWKMYREGEKNSSGAVEGFSGRRGARERTMRYSKVAQGAEDDEAYDRGLPEGDDDDDDDVESQQQRI